MSGHSVSLSKPRSYLFQLPYSRPDKETQEHDRSRSEPLFIFTGCWPPRLLGRSRSTCVDKLNYSLQLTRFFWRANLHMRGVGGNRACLFWRRVQTANRPLQHCVSVDKPMPGCVVHYTTFGRFKKINNCDGVIIDFYLSTQL